MGTHQEDSGMRPDEEYIRGDLSFIVEGNKCRLLDGRRTTGYIESYDNESAMFRWRITKYEDEGKYWDLPVEEITSFQFEKDSKCLPSEEIEKMNTYIEKYSEELVIEANDENKIKTDERIKEIMPDAIQWFKTNSEFIANGETLDFDKREGSKTLAKDLKEYMKAVQMEVQETLTCDTLVLNPNSGEWFKGMSIILAELGLANYYGKIPRTKDIFTDKGSKEKREEYLIHRIAFVRAFFHLMNIEEVTLYRGMSTTQDFKEVKRTYLPCTFSLEVAQDFSDLKRESRFKNSYIIKLTCPVEKLLMTYLETEAMNRQYKEAEAIVFYDQSIMI